MSEDELKKSVLDLCKLLHLRTAHFRPAMTSKGYRTPVEGDGKGWPDLIICGKRLIIRELKQQAKYPSPDQRLWIAALTVAGVDVAVWKPSDWASGRIERELKEIA